MTEHTRSDFPPERPVDDADAAGELADLGDVDAPVPDAAQDPRDPEDAARVPSAAAPVGDELGVEVPEADAIEQRADVPRGDDDYR